MQPLRDLTAGSTLAGSISSSQIRAWQIENQPSEPSCSKLRDLGPKSREVLLK